jgi:meso-butanediol dehydrogenase / (S,S)-butanediol dehydrogenase / diacetyl reductase
MVDSNGEPIDMETQLALNGMSVAITGAGQGIGKGLALQFARAGARLVIVDLNESGAATACEEVRANGGDAVWVHADVTDAQACERMVQHAARSFGRLDLMICNAGVVQVKPFMDSTANDWDSVLSINVKGTFLSLQAAARQMVGQERLGPGRPRGKVITMASIAGRYGAGPMAPFIAPYRASKAAVISLTQSAAYSLAPDITVNAICPGLVATDMWKRMDSALARIEDGEEGEAFARRVGAVPLGRAQTPEDVGGLALYLASAAADYMTGQSINIDGGLVMN